MGAAVSILLLIVVVFAVVGTATDQSDTNRRGLESLIGFIVLADAVLAILYLAGVR